MNKDVSPSQKPLAIWLFTCVGLIFTMVIIGAITRLTDSGLSMVEWRPLFGALPPLNEIEWNRVFSLYQQSPEFSAKHSWMGISDFKKIFFWEWSHRLLGRFIGLAYALPMVWFWIRGAVPRAHKPALILLLVLGGCQGLMGWYMVQSGLIDNPAVSHYRLAAHLSLALILYSGCLWMGLRFAHYNTPNPEDNIKKAPLFKAHIFFTLCCIVLTIIWGAFVAGLDAGLIYNAFPKMGEGLMPSEMWRVQPSWRNIFENHAAVQFVHRWIAVGTVCAIFSLWAHSIIQNRTRLALHALCIMAFIQMCLGIATLLSGVHLPLAVMHQGGAVIVLTLLLITMFKDKLAQGTLSP